MNKIAHPQLSVNKRQQKPYVFLFPKPINLNFCGSERLLIDKLKGYDRTDRKFLLKGLTWNLTDRRPAEYKDSSALLPQVATSPEAHTLTESMPPESRAQGVETPAPDPAEVVNRDNSIANKYHLPQVWAEYLDSFNPWSWYGHFSFRGTPHPETASKTFDLFVHKLNRQIFGCRYYKHPEKGVTWARASEYQKRGAVHFHAILGRIPEDVRRFQYMDLWYELGGISRVYPYQSRLGAEYYMSKSTYAWKKGEIDLGGPLLQSLLTS